MVTFDNVECEYFKQLYCKNGTRQNNLLHHNNCFVYIEVMSQNNFNGREYKLKWKSTD